MDADFVSLGNDAARLIRIDQGGNGGNEEACGGIVVGKQIEDTGYSDPAPEFGPAKSADSLSTRAKLSGFMIAVE